MTDVILNKWNIFLKYKKINASKYLVLSSFRFVTILSCLKEEKFDPPHYMKLSDYVIPKLIYRKVNTRNFLLTKF